MISIGKGNMKSISTIQSIHEDSYEDRVWKFICQSDLNITSSCSWKRNGRVNNLDGSFSYICPRKGHIVGMDASTLNGYYKDREFNIKCCNGAVKRKNCRWTHYVHDWDARMNYNVPSGYFLAGASSYHDNYYEYVIFIQSI